MRARTKIVGLMAWCVLAAIAGPAAAQVQATLHKDTVYRGATLDVTEDIPNLHVRGFGDLTSSITFRGDAPISIYTRPNYQGQCYVVGRNVERLSSTPFPNDDVSSVRVSFHCENGEINRDACAVSPCGAGFTCVDKPRPAPTSHEGRVCTPIPGRPTSLATGRPARQSSTAYGGDATRAVDGRTDGVWGAGSITSTAGEANAWLEIDLGESKAIGEVVLHNRTDCCADRLVGATVALQLGRCDAQAAAQQVQAAAGPVPSAAPLHAFKFASRSARYVCVRQPAAKILSLAEVEVFSPVDDACLANPCPGGRACTDLPGLDLTPAGRTCGCGAGYQPDGAGECVDIDECAGPALACAAGTCENQPGSFVCTNDDAWLVAGEPGFPTEPRAGALAFAATTTMVALRLPTALVTGPTRLVVRDATSGRTLATSPRVARGAGVATEVALHYTLFGGRAYSLALATELAGTSRERTIGSADVPLARVAFAVVPHELMLTPPFAVSGVERVPASGPITYGVSFDRPTIVTGVVLHGRAAPGAGFPALTARISDGAQVVAERQGTTSGLDRQLLPLVADAGAGRAYRVSIGAPAGSVLIDQLNLVAPATCGVQVRPFGGKGVARVDGQYGDAACAWSTATGSAPHGSLTALSITMTRLALEPAEPRLGGELVSGGITTRAYEIRFDRTVSISGVTWTATVPADAAITARIWDEAGALVATGLPVNGTGTLTELGSPLTFTFQAGRTYRVGFHDPGGRTRFARRSGLAAPHALGPLRVQGSVASAAGADASAAPDQPGAPALELALMLTAGACNTPACAP